MAILDSINTARQRGANDDQILQQIYKQNPAKQSVIDSAKQRGANSGQILAEITKQNQPMSVGGFLGNILPSAGRFIGGIAGAVAHPINTLKGIAKIGAGAVQEVIPGTGEQYKPAAEAVGQFFKQRYGGLKNIERTAYEDPVGVLADLSALVSGGGAIASKVGDLAEVSKLAEAGDIASRIGEMTEPTGLGLRALKAVAAPPVKLAGRVAGETLGFTTGAGYGAIREALRNPSSEFTAAMRGEISGEDILSSSRDALENVRQQRSAAYQKELAGIAKQKGSFDISPLSQKIDQQLKAFNVKTNTDGSLNFGRSTIVDKAEANRVGELVDTVKNWGTQKGDRTAVGLDLLKRRLDDFYSPSGQARALVTSMKNSVKDILNKNVPGYYKMTSEYAKSTDMIKEIEKALSLKTTASADTAIRKLTSVLRENNDFRKSLVAKLQGASGTDLKGMIAGTALSQAMPRGLTAKLLGEGGFLAGLVNPKFWAVLGMASPRLTGEFLRVLGIGGKQAQKILDAAKASGIASPAVGQTLYQVGRLRNVVNPSLNQSPVETLKQTTR